MFAESAEARRVEELGELLDSGDKVVRSGLLFGCGLDLLVEVLDLQR